MVNLNILRNIFKSVLQRGLRRMFFERFDELAKQHNSNVNTVGKELKFSSGSLTAWKNGTKPNSAAVTKIAQYFNVTNDYLLGVTDIPNHIELLEGVEYAFLQGYKQLDDEDKAELNRAAQRMLELKQLREGQQT